MILIIVASLATATCIEIGFGLYSLLGSGQIWDKSPITRKKNFLFSELNSCATIIANQRNN
jgi:hypothetical protein